jgi:UDP-N-acetylglucosamine--N-acetylmuramyl-(pentapeptide) pyrophosphoryl-undecaprenol N-acetylglucosamine transferase
MEAELVNRAGIPFRSIPAAGVHGVGLRALPGNLARLSRGYLASRPILKDFRPDVLFFTGGYLAAPMALAGRSTPSLMYVPDIEPGLAIRTAAPLVDRIAVTSEASLGYFRGRRGLAVTGYPLRSDLAGWTRERGRHHLGLSSSSLPVVLVTGGSRGARSLNNAVLDALPRLLETAEVVHIAGSLDWAVVEAAAESLPRGLKQRYQAMPYLHEMGAALASADLVVSRAGASTLGEYPLFGLPAILVPYPYAWRYQKVNADALARHGAAVVLEDRLLGTELLPLITGLLADPTRLDAMRRAMHGLSRPGAADAIAGQLTELAEARSG